MSLPIFLGLILGVVGRSLIIIANKNAMCMNFRKFNTVQSLFNTPRYNVDLNITQPCFGSQNFYHGILQKNCSSLITGRVTVSCPCLVELDNLSATWYWFNPGRPVPDMTENC